MTWSYEDYRNYKIKPKVFAGLFIKILKKKSFLVIVLGDAGSGKSYTVCSICEMINPSFNRKDVIDILKGVKPRLRELEAETKEGRTTPKTINLDDFGSELDALDYATTAAKQTSWLMQKGRKLKVGCFLTVPDKELINKTFRERIPNFILEVLGHNEATGYAEIKLFRLQRNKRTGKVYYHRIYYDQTKDELSLKNKPKFIPQSRFRIPKPSQKLIDWYEPFRTELGTKQLQEEEKQEIKTNPIETLSQEIIESGETYLKTWRGKKTLNKELVCALLTIDGAPIGRKTADKLSAYLKHKKII